MFGFFNINKPRGPTSHDIVDRLRRRIGRREKVGHCGTLDPFACGVLVICVGPATRLAGYVQRQSKQYRAQLALGAVSTTDDPEGEIETSPAASGSQPGMDDIRRALAGFVGETLQTPPMHSAVFVAGQRAYELARKGRQPVLEPRKVTIYSIELVHYAWPLVEIDIRCASGTYVRSLARDLGQALGVGGYCKTLTRTAIGEFTMEQAVDADSVDPARHLISPLAALGAMPRVSVSPHDYRRLALGQGVRLEGLQCPRPPAGDPHTPVELAILDHAGELVAIGKIDRPRGQLRPLIVFRGAEGPIT